MNSLRIWFQIYKKCYNLKTQKIFIPLYAVNNVRSHTTMTPCHKQNFKMEYTLAHKKKIIIIYFEIVFNSLSQIHTVF
jgi:hypothetical protein